MASAADIRGYGGAMGGGKSRTMCEAALDLALDFPGIQIVMARHEHTAIIETTKKTMQRYVLAGLEGLVARTKNSQGEDLIELVNGSEFAFIGSSKPGKWYSAEIGALVVDEAHECDEADIIQLKTRLRQEGMPCRMLVGFNPGNPGHWLQDWFIRGASQTEHGFYKAALELPDAEEGSSAGSCEFVFANAYDNPHLPKTYIEQNLRSMPKLMRQRLLEGQWVLQDGSLFFDPDALGWYASQMERPWRVGSTAGDPAWDAKDPMRVKVRSDGPLAVWKPPVRATEDSREHRYVVTVDPSTGGSSDYTGIQVLDVDSFEQVAEVQAKLDSDLAAVEAFRLAAIYNGALLAVEVTGGYGYPVVKTIEKLQRAFKGPRERMPRLYTRRIEDRLAKKFTDVLGWDTNTRTRMAMLDALEEVIREKSLILRGQRTYEEMRSFAFKKTSTGKNGKPEALRGKHDDLVMPLAIAVYLAVNNHVKSPKRVRVPQHAGAFGATGY